MLLIEVLLYFICELFYLKEDWIFEVGGKNYFVYDILYDVYKEMKIFWRDV